MREAQEGRREGERERGKRGGGGRWGGRRQRGREGGGERESSISCTS